MYLLYNLILTFGAVFALPFYFLKMVTTGKYRGSFLQKFGFLPSNLKNKISQGDLVWIHAVSVGEVLSCISVIKGIRKEHPNIKILLSTVTETGNYTANTRLTEVDAVIFFPLDFKWIVKRVINVVNPRMFIIIETDIWPNLLRELKKRKVPCIVINGRVSPRSHRGYCLFKGFFKSVFDGISIFSMQSDVDSDRIIESGANIDNVMVTGNLKFDQTVPVINEAGKISILTSMGIGPTQNIFIAGSTHKGEEEVILDVYEILKKEWPNLVLILAPRNPERFTEVESLVSMRRLNFVRRTKTTENSHSNAIDVIILDTIGELSNIYSVGSLIFVGGSLVNTGGHNLLEPAAYKKAVLFGPHVYNFSEISQVLKESGGGIQVENKEEFLFHAKRLLDDPSLLKKLGESAYNVIETNQGSTQRNMDIINRFL